MPFHIIRNDITKLEVDVIVNAANKRLQLGGGVCGAIFSAAGEEKLQKACDRIGFCDTGNAVITKAYHLPAKFIIHTVGPIYGENPREEEQQLYLCYKNSLLLAKRKRLTSIAFPVISSGIYGYPKVEAIKIASKAIKDFLETNDMIVYLVVYDKETFQISEQLFLSVQSFINEKMVKQEVRRRTVSYLEKTDNNKLLLREESAIFESNKKVDFRPKETMYQPNIPPSFSVSMAQSMPKQEEKREKRSLEDLMQRKVETFSEMLLRLIDEKGMTDVEVYKRANIDRKLFSKIRKKDYIPRKITVIALAIGLKLNLDETKDLLGRAGFALSDCNKFDIIIEYFIENENYDIFEINETLFAFEQQLLGA